MTVEHVASREAYVVEISADARPSIIREALMGLYGHVDGDFPVKLHSREYWRLDFDEWRRWYRVSQ